MQTINGVFSSDYIKPEKLVNHIGQTVRIHGTIYKIREMAAFAFVILSTGRSLLQCVYSPEFSDFGLCELKENSSVIIEGNVVREPRSRAGFEVRLLHYKALSRAYEEMPVVINNRAMKVSLETLLDYRPITLRNEKERAIFQIQAGICAGFREFFRKNNFTEIHTPKIVSSGAEGGANIFKLNYFNREAYLTQSPQFYKQMMVGVFERVFEIGPVFRAERHDTSRHMNEYTSVDFEMGFIDSFYDLMQLETKMLQETIQYLNENYSIEISLLGANIPMISEIPAIPFLEAKELIAQSYHYESTDNTDFDPEEEKLLCEIIKKKTGCDFVFVTHYKSSKRPFYAMDSKGNPKLTESFDLLFRGVEITTGGQRIHDYQEQINKMKARGMDIESFGSYLMAHKYGLPPHGGLGLGLERFTAKLLGFDNVRRATMFPRDINRLEP